MVRRVLVKEGICRDSISLMQISTSLAKLPVVSQAAVVRVGWKPPAGGDAEMIRILDKLGS